jgi:hypothetical protein
MATMTIDTKQQFEVVESVRVKLQIALDLSRVLEETLADLVAAYTPLLAPLIPATIGFYNIQGKSGLDFGPGRAFLYAVIVEFLGLATTTTALQFRAWNKEQNKKAPLWLALVMAAFYLTVVLTVNVALDTGTDLQKWVKAAASTFSIVGAVTMALRNEQAKRMAEKLTAEIKVENDQRQGEERARAEKLEDEQRALAVKVAEDERNYQRQVQAEERARAHALRLLKLEKAPVKVAETFQKVSEAEQKVPETFGKWKDWRKVPESEKQVMATFETPEQVAETYGVSPKTAGNWLKNAKDLAEVQ